MVIILCLDIRPRVRARIGRAIVLYNGAQPDIAGGTASSHFGTVAGLAGIRKMLGLCEVVCQACVRLANVDDGQEQMAKGSL